MESTVIFDPFNQNALSAMQMYYTGSAAMDVKFFLNIPLMEN
jgi:hypothetical protein